MINIEFTELPPECEVLRREVREFLAATLPLHPREEVDTHSGFDLSFSKKLGARGWIGMTLPKKYGGHERSHFERYVVVEELLASKAPVAAHWMSDRQSAPHILHYGNETMKAKILPGIVRGEIAFCVGLSEPDAGSDLAAIRTKAEKTAGGWILNGRKIWNNGHRAHYMMALVRTSPAGTNRHEGFSQFVIDLSLPGITISPIRNLLGFPGFSEVLFENAFVPDDSLLGVEGAGWKQALSELGVERGGPDRYLSSIDLLFKMVAEASPGNARHETELGKLIAHAMTLRKMSVGLAGMFHRKEDPGIVVAMLKDLGNTFEQSIPDAARDLFEYERGDESNAFARTADVTTQLAVSYSIRGGAREILRGMIAKGLSLR